MNPRSLRIYWLGSRDYEPVHALQQALQQRRIAGEIGDVLLFVEHTPSITLGRSARRENVLFDDAYFAARGVTVAEVGRGGDVTYHGPGQIVGYPIVDLRPDRCDLRAYVRSLGEYMILVARDHYVEAGMVDGKIGVWADAQNPGEWGTFPWAARPTKIGAIGVRVSRWVTMHGFALNLDVDLSHFAWIVPCGITDLPVSSIAKLTGKARAVRDVALSTAHHVERALDTNVVEVRDVSGERDLERVFGAARVAQGPAVTP